ncbi:MAG: VCBS repeat-containing protein [Deltaproteobacteria bacterium]|nr:VCBS repeat-containing protein [Deltaproteobacteria bacterium]
MPPTRPSRPLSVSLTCIACLSVMGCTQASPVPRDAGLQVAVAPLLLPGVANACYTITVSAASGTVWSRSGICADAYGDGVGSVSYVGPCDASGTGMNTVSLVLDDLYASNGTSSPIDATTWQNPCGAPGSPTYDGRPACTREVRCEPNADALVTFNLTIMRDAGQGFFDLAIDLDNVFCSAKLDCADPTTHAPIRLLFDGPTRGPTAVLALACSAGLESGVDTVLSMTDIVLSCADGFRETIDPSAGSGGNFFTPSRDADLFQVATYEGSESLLCAGTPCHTRYWNVALGVRWASLAAHHGDCSITARATVSDGLLPGARTPAGWTYPVIDFAVPVTGLVPSLGRRDLVCAAHPLATTGPVSTQYVGPSPSGPFCSHFDGVSSEREPACPPIPPGAPTGVVATAGVRQVSLTWAAPAAPGVAVTGYTILQSWNGGPYLPSAATITGTSAIITDLIADGSYRFVVIATNTFGDSPASAPSNAVTPTRPAPHEPAGKLGFPDMMLAAGPARTLVAVDLDGDGARDIAVANYVGDSTIGVFLQNARGGFDPQVTYPAIADVAGIEAGDFDEDGHPDLIATNYNAYAASVYLNQGDGTFAPHVTYPIGLSSGAVVVGDLDGDDHLDFIATNAGAASMTRYLGVGDGTFTSALTLSTGPSPAGPALADLDHDGVLDLVLPLWYGGIETYLGVGDGTFTHTSSGSSAYGAANLEAADLDGDGHLDVVSQAYSDGTVGVHLGDGTGAFASPLAYTVGGNPEGLALGDVDEDGAIDIVVANEYGLPQARDVSLLVNEGDGTFAAPAGYTTAQAPEHAYCAELADMNGDGRLDLLGCNLSGASGSVSVVWNVGGGRFAQTAEHAVGADVGQGRALAGDFDEDGQPDLAVPSSGGAVVILLGAGGGAFTLAGTIAAPGDLRRGAVGDLDHDAHLDLAVPDMSGDRLYVLLGNGDGTFAVQTVGPTGDAPSAVAADDVDGDDDLDLLVAAHGASRVETWLGAGTGTFVLGSTTTTAAGPSRIALGDFDLDGRDDVAVVADLAGGGLQILHNDGGGSFGAGAPIATADATPTDVATGDVDGDGRRDIVVANGASGSDSVSLFVNAAGAFGARADIATGGRAEGIALADLDVDGALDIAATDHTKDRIQVLLGKGDATFVLPVAFAAPSGTPSGPIVYDLDGDSRDDIAYVTAQQLVGIMLNPALGVTP